MTPMPHHMEKGPYLSMFENLLNKKRAVTLDVLHILRDRDRRVSDVLREYPTAITKGPWKNTDELADHVDTDWFGLPKGSGKQPDYSSATNPTTGEWHHWYGDAQEIFREGMIRAIEVSLGLEAGTDNYIGYKEMSNPRTRLIRWLLGQKRHWRIDLCTVCGIHWLEVWIGWQEHDTGPKGGHVNLTFLTPPHTSPVDKSVLGTGGKVAPYDKRKGKYGLWIVAPEHEERQHVDSVTKSWFHLGAGLLPLPEPGWRGEGPILVVAPPEAAGGVEPGGRHYPVKGV